MSAFTLGRSWVFYLPGGTYQKKKKLPGGNRLGKERATAIM